jgi:hypothetical protein
MLEWSFGNSLAKVKRIWAYEPCDFLFFIFYRKL